MARPRKEGLDYFPLDIHFDEKIKALESLHQNDGLVWIIKFWQSAYSNNEGEVDLNGIFGVIRAENCRITTGKQATIVSNCLEIGLITKKKEGIYTSNGIQKRLDMVVKDRESERKRKLVGSFPPENKPLTRERKENGGKLPPLKESKVKEIKEKKNKVFVPPTLDQVKDYCLERKNKVDAEYFYEKNTGIGWVDKNGNKYKDWKAVIRTWEKWEKNNERTNANQKHFGSDNDRDKRKKLLDGLG